MVSIQWLRSSGQRFLVNVDGMYFPGDGPRRRLRDRLLAGADGYLIAGVKTGGALIGVAGNAPIYPYRFSSLTREQIGANRAASDCAGDREGFVLCVGQFLAYKGIDVLVDVAKELPGREFVLVGASRRGDDLRELCGSLGCGNVTTIDFLASDELGDLYRRCACMVLPSRQECWGLVVNEALSFGAPVVSTWGAGAAVELLSDDAPERLAIPGDAASLRGCLTSLLEADIASRAALDGHLSAKASEYSIESTVEDHVRAFESILSTGDAS